MFDLRTIAEVEGAGVKAGKHAEWKEQIIVPPLPQSVLAGCSLIDIDYFIQVSGASPSAAPVSFLTLCCQAMRRFNLINYWISNNAFSGHVCSPLNTVSRVN